MSEGKGLTLLTFGCSHVLTMISTYAHGRSPFRVETDGLERQMVHALEQQSTEAVSILCESKHVCSRQGRLREGIRDVIL